MPIKRIALNISLPDAEFKRKINEYAKRHGVSPSSELVALYRRKFLKNKWPPSPSNHRNAASARKSACRQALLRFSLIWNDSKSKQKTVNCLVLVFSLRRHCVKNAEKSYKVYYDTSWKILLAWICYMASDVAPLCEHEECSFQRLWRTWNYSLWIVEGFFWIFYKWYGKTPKQRIFTRSDRQWQRLFTRELSVDNS